MIIRHLFAFLSTFLVLATADGLRPAVGRDARPWPMEIDIHLSSSFAEFRPGHLHAGVDIRTFGREGVPCIAVGDGHISRIRAAYNGYGLALYLTLGTGETAVYAHLAEFSPELQRELERQQEHARRYRVDLYYEEDRFPVSRGDTIGYSGSTGASAPHLHFEFRDRYQNPMNPLSQGWTVPDRRAPRMLAVTWIPLDTASRIDGRCRPRTVPLSPAGAAGFTAEETVSLSGPAGLGVHIVDRVDGNSGRLAPHRVELLVGGKLLAAVEMERFSYDHTGEVELAYDMERLRTDSGYYLLLFRREGETLWDRTFSNGGRIDPRVIGDGGTAGNIAVIRATDRAGNTSVARVPFRTGGWQDQRGGDVASGGETGASGPWLDDVFVFDDLLSADAGRLGGILDWFGASVQPADGQIVARVAHARGESRRVTTPERVVHFVALDAGTPLSADFDELGFGVAASPGSLYGSTFVYVTADRSNEGRTVVDGLRAVGDPVLLGPPSLVLKGRLGLRFALPAEDPRAGVYHLDHRRGRWRHAGSVARPDTVYAYISAPGVYRVFTDVAAPTVGPCNVEMRERFATGMREPELVFRIEDEGSGVDAEAVEVRIDGRLRIGRWNGFSDTMYVPLGGLPDKRSYQVTVTARDRAGNETTRGDAFHLPASGAGSSEGEDSSNAR